MAILELLGRQRKHRIGTADDVLAAAARDHAAGKTPDVAAVDAALHELGQPIERFAELCAVAELRRDAGAAFEKLGLATTKERRVADAIASETAKYEEARKAFLAKVAALEAEKSAADVVIAKAQQARETLLLPKNVLGSIRQRYDEVLAERQEALAAVEQARADVRKSQSRIKEADRWIASIVKAADSEISPRGLMARSPTLPPSVQRDLEPHELAKKRAQRRLDEAQPVLRAAEDRLDRAERAVVAVEIEILKS